MFKKLIVTLAFVLFGTFTSGVSFAQTKCEGPPELCSQIIDLQTKLKNQDAVFQQGKVAAVNEAKAATEKRNAERLSKFIAMSAVLGIVLKVALSSLQAWKGYFKTDKGKAWLKVISLGAGLAAFIFTNIGLAVPWHLAIVLALGGPGAITIHELYKLIPVLKGKKTLAQVAQEEKEASDKEAAEKAVEGNLV